jgi:hypothetical protein
MIWQPENSSLLITAKYVRWQIQIYKMEYCNQQPTEKEKGFIAKMGK